MFSSNFCTKNYFIFIILLNLGIKRPKQGVTVNIKRLNKSTCILQSCGESRLWTLGRSRCSYPTAAKPVEILAANGSHCLNFERRYCGLKMECLCSMILGFLI